MAFPPVPPSYPSSQKKGPQPPKPSDRPAPAKPQGGKPRIPFGKGNGDGPSAQWKQQAAQGWQKTHRTLRGNTLLRTLVIFLSLSIVALFLVSMFLKIYTRHGQKFIVPTLIGQSVDDAAKLAKKGDLRLEIIDSLYMPKQPPGVILDQSPKPGMGVKSGRRVFLTINAFRPRTAVIPYVAGFSLRQAKNVLENKGFEIERLVYRNDMATNNVLEERYEGTLILSGNSLEAELGSAITLVVGVNHGDPLPQVPKVIGLTLREARSRLWEVGLNLGETKYDLAVPADQHEDARVYRQEPNLLSRSDYGGRVALWLTLDPAQIASSEKESETRARTISNQDVEDDELLDTDPSVDEQ